MDEPTRDPEAWAQRLEELRRSANLRMDAEGRWYQDDEPFTHARLIAAFDAGVDAHPETGEPILRLGGRWCYFTAEDTPFIVRRLDDDGAALVATLNNGETWPVPEAGFEAIDDRIYVELTPSRRARLSRPVHNGLVDRLEETPAGPVIRGADRVWPVRISSDRT